MTEPSNHDYDNGVSDNCDQNFGTFDDFGVKNDQKVSHNMILMSKYKGQHGGKTGSKNSGRGLPPPFRAMPKRKHFFFREGFPNSDVIPIKAIPYFWSDSPEDFPINLPFTEFV